MADLLDPGDNRTRIGARPWARAASRPHAEPAGDPSGWPQRVHVPAAFPTRMARRRALQADAIGHDWAPDPTITTPLLLRVEDELAGLLDLTPAPLLPGSTVPARPPRRRPRWLVPAVAAGLALAITAVVVLQDDREPPARASLAPTVRQDVVALALSTSGQVSGVSLLASGDGAGQQVLVPSRLVIDVPGAGRVPLTQALTPGRSALGAALADALEVRVDATWVLDTQALAALVAAVGGVVVDVDVDVASGPDAGAALVVAAGAEQRLTGGQAAAYAQWIVGSEPEPSRLARQQRVVEAVLGALPVDATARRALVAGLPMAPTGADLQAVVDTTGGLRAQAAAGRLASTVLPVDDIDAGGDEASYGLDVAGASAMVRSRLAGAALAVPAGGRTRVLVQNGVGTPGLGDAARSRLVAAGLRYVAGGNVEGFGVAESVVLVSDGSAANRARGASVVSALGLTPAALRISDAAPTIADLIVVLGADFAP